MGAHVVDRVPLVSFSKHGHHPIFDRERSADVVFEFGDFPDVLVFAHDGFVWGRFVGDRDYRYRRSRQASGEVGCVSWGGLRGWCLNVDEPGDGGVETACRMRWFVTGLNLILVASVRRPAVYHAVLTLVTYNGLP